MVAIDPATKKVQAETVEGQTERAVRNCELVLKAGGASLGDVVQVLVLLRNPQDFDAMNRAYSKIFSKDMPARAVAKPGSTFRTYSSR